MNNCGNVLTIDHLDFAYDKTAVLEDVNVTIRAGEFIGIFGPNGGGKTTLMQLILGLLQPSKGTIRLFDKRPVEAQGLIGYVPQMLASDKQFPISVLEVVEMGALRRLNWLGRYPREVREKAKAALRSVGLEHKEKAAFGSLSGGQAQRALIARAILDKPQMLILDEPTAHLDPSGAQEIQKLLLELNQNTTILMVTHDLQTIIDKVGRLLCVQRKVTCLQTAQVCEHFALGLYHTPLSPHANTHFLPKS